MRGAPLTRELILAYSRFFAEFDQGKPVYEAYQDFCRVLGNDAMTYRDFDYWYYRFKDGKFDLEHEKNEDAKALELMNFSNEILKMIVGKLPLEDILILRNVSKALRNVVDNMKYSFQDCCLTIEDDYYSVTLEKFGIQERVKRGNWKQLLKDFEIMMNWPKINVECLNINIDLNEQDTIQVLEAFKSLNHQIPVAKFRIFPRRVDQILAVLPYLKPGILENIIIIGDHYINLNEIVDLDQWKQAKHCDIRKVEFQIESLFHLESIRINVRRMSVDDFAKLKKALLASPNFESCFVKIYNRADGDAIREYNSTYEIIPDEIISIPETNQLFKIEFGGKDDDRINSTFAFKKTTA